MIPDFQAPTALFYCCSDDLRSDILRDLRTDPAKMSEKDLLGVIKKLSVREESTKDEIEQNGAGTRDECKNFLGKLKGPGIHV